jgi:hypothetical protein
VVEKSHAAPPHVLRRRLTDSIPPQHHPGIVRLMTSRSQARMRGQAQTEYAIILVGVAVISILVIVNFGGKIATLLGFAHDEIDTMGGADLEFSGGLESGSGNDSVGSDSSSSGSDGGGDEGGAGGTSTSRGRSGGGGRGGGGGASAKAGDDGFNKPSEVRKSGTYQLEGEGGSTTVHAGRAPGTKDQSPQGTAASRREAEARKAGDQRRYDEERWQKRRSEAFESERGEVETKDAPVLGFMRFALLAVLLLGVLFLGRSLIGGVGGGGDED